MALLWSCLPTALISHMSPARAATQQLYLRAMDSLESKPIPGTEGAFNPFFSPDGQWLGFFAGGKLKKVSASGGAAVTLGDAPDPHGASWGSQGIIAFAPTNASALQQVSDSGGTPQPLSRLEKGEVSHRWPELLPGGKAMFFAAGNNGINFSNSQVAVQSVGTGERRSLAQGMNPRYTPSGHLVYAQGGEPDGRAVRSPAARGHGHGCPCGRGCPAIHNQRSRPVQLFRHGIVGLCSGGLQANQRRLVWVSRNGTEQPSAAPAHTYQFPRVSPDGRRVAVAIAEQETQVWLYDLSRETLTRFTFEGNAEL